LNKEKSKKSGVSHKESFSGRLFYSGLILLITGFITLGFAGRMADNFAGTAAPFILLAGWLLIAAGLWKNE